MSICVQRTDAADGGCGDGLDFAPMHAARRPLQLTTGKSTTTGVDFEPWYN